MAGGYVATALVMLMSPVFFPVLAIIAPVRSHAPRAPLLAVGMVRQHTSISCHVLSQFALCIRRRLYAQSA